MKRIKPKFKAIWDKPMRFRLPAEDLQPFPGSALLRWVLIEKRTGKILYEGKPSTQAMHLGCKGKYGGYIIEFDKASPIALVHLFPDAQMEFGESDWRTWRRFHGEKDVPTYYRAIFKGEAGAGL